MKEFAKMTPDQHLVFTLCLISGSVLILGQIVVAILAIVKAKVTTNPDEPTIASLSAEKLFDLLKSLATSAPLMLGGVVLYLVAAIAAKSITLG
jgi:hypothetical protein